MPFVPDKPRQATATPGFRPDTSPLTAPVRALDSRPVPTPAFTPDRSAGVQRGMEPPALKTTGFVPDAGSWRGRAGSDLAFAPPPPKQGLRKALPFLFEQPFKSEITPKETVEAQFRVKARQAGLSYDEYKAAVAEKVTGVTPFSPLEKKMGVAAGVLMGGAIAAPIVASIGLKTVLVSTLKYLTIHEGIVQAKSGVVSAIKGEKYSPRYKRKVSELLPPDIKTQIKSSAQVAEWVAELYLAGKGVRTLNKATPAIKQAVTKNVITEANLPRTVSISNEKVRDIFSEGTKVSAEELSLYKDLGLSGKQVSSIIKGNRPLTINVPAEKLVTIVDKPYWAKLKAILGKPASPPVVTRVVSKPVVDPVIGLLPSKAPIPSTPKPIVPRGTLAVAPAEGAKLTPGFVPDVPAKVKKVPGSAIPVEPVSPGGYRKRGLNSAITMRMEEPAGSLANYDERSQSEWLGESPPADGRLTLYRATPAGDAIAPGDYVSNDKAYVQGHIDADLGGKGKITSMKATLDDLYPADGPKEFWYVPEDVGKVPAQVKLAGVKPTKSVETGSKSVEEKPYEYKMPDDADIEPALIMRREPMKPVEQMTPEALRTVLSDRIKGDKLENAVDLATTLQAKGGAITPTGEAVVYHRTTADNAAAIVRDQSMTSKEDGLFFGTRPTGQIEGYGDAVVEVSIPLERLALNDEFTDEAHVWMQTGTIRKKISVTAKLHEGPLSAPPKKADITGAKQPELGVKPNVEKTIHIFEPPVLKPSGVKPIVRKVTGQVRPSKPVEEWVALKNLFRRQAAVAKKAVSMTRSEIRANQAEVIRLLRASKLAPADKAKFIGTIKSIHSREQLLKKFPAIEEKIDRLRTKAQRKKLTTKIKVELLRKYKAKKRAPGKTTVEYEMLRNVLKKKFFNGSKLRTQAENEELLNQLQESIESYDVSQPAHFADFALYAALSDSTQGLGEMAVEDLAGTLQNIVGERELAADSFLARQVTRAVAIENEVARSVENMQGLGIAKQPPSTRRDIAGKMRKFFAAVGPDVHDRGFMQIMNLLDSVRGGRFFKDVIYQPISEANKTFMVEEEKFLEQDKKFLETLFKAKGNILDLKINQLTKQKHIGTVTDAKGKKVDLWLSDLDMIDYYLSARTDETLRALKKAGVYIGGQDKEGRVLSTTDEILAKIESKISKEAKQMADYAAKFIRDKKFQGAMANAYEGKYNKPFPFVKGGYWTMIRRYMGSQEKGGDIFNPEFSGKVVLSPNSFQKRVKSDAPLIMGDGWSKFIKWRSDILRFVHYDKALMNAKAVIMSKDFKSEFVEQYGNSSYKHLLNSFDITANGMTHYDDVLAKGANHIRQILSVAYIGAKSRNVLSQGTSFVAAVAEMPVKDFILGIKKFRASPWKSYNKMMSSPLIRFRHRRANFSRGLFEQDVKKFRKYGQTPTTLAFFFVRVGDMTGVIGAGHIVYEYNFDRYKAGGMDKAQADKLAMQDAENFVISTQQSALPEMKNLIMQAHPLIRSAGAFQQAQAQYRAYGYQAMNTWLNSGDKWSRKNFEPMMKQVFVWHFVLPALYELSRGNVNPVSLFARTTFTPISGFMGYGRIVEWAILVTIVSVFIPAKYKEKWKAMLPFDPNSLPGDAKKMFERTMRSAGKLVSGSAGQKDIINMIDGGSTLLKVPSKNIREEYAKFRDVFTGKDASLLRLLQTQWQSNERLKKKTSTAHGIPAKSIPAREIPKRKPNG